MSIRFESPKGTDSIIKVIGVGGGGSNAVNHMHNLGIVGVEFIICNTDEQALEQSVVPSQIQLGPSLTDGRGAGSQPEVGKNATIESLEDIKKAIGSGTKMVFITAGMGGGTGTGGAPVVAKAARELGILTVGIVTAPFSFEGRRRILQAQKGVDEMRDSVDTLIVISNDKLRELHGNLSLSEAFTRADDILSTAAKGIAEIITVPGYVNVDFEDVSTVMRSSGVAIMGTGIADGEDRAMKAVKTALASPLLNDNDIRGAKHILLNITSGTKEVLMDEVGDITNYIQEAAGYTSEVIWGNCVDETLGEKLSVTVIATGFETTQDKYTDMENEERVVLSLDDKPVAKRRRREETFNRTRRKERVVFNFDDEDPQPKREPFRDHEEDDYDQDYGYETEELVTPPARKEREQPFATKRKTADNQEDHIKVFMERRKRLRGLSMKLQSSELNEIEREPAYKRRNVRLDDMPHSSESNVSKYTLFEEEGAKKPEIKKRNPFLHDNVD